MTRISKKILSSDSERKLNSQLAKFFSNQKENKIQKLFSDLLTPTEQIMLIKRLAMVIMITKGESCYRIAQVLNVSDSTAREVKTKIKLGQYQNLVAHYKNKNFNSKEFWETVEMILRAGMPSRGKDRWQSVHFD